MLLVIFIDASKILTKLLGKIICKYRSILGAWATSEAIHKLYTATDVLDLI